MVVVVKGTVSIHVGGIVLLGAIRCQSVFKPSLERRPRLFSRHDRHATYSMRRKLRATSLISFFSYQPAYIRYVFDISIKSSASQPDISLPQRKSAPGFVAFDGEPDVVRELGRLQFH